MKIKGYELKDKTVLEIGKFAILWNCFEMSGVTITALQL